MRLKILSLELMLGVLENSGPVLQGSLRFINGAIKKYLCNSILMNGVSPVPRVFQASLSLFSTLIAKFNQHLKVRSHWLIAPGVRSHAYRGTLVPVTS